MTEDQGFRLVAADHVSMTTVWRAFVDGFQGYVVPVQIDQAAFETMIAAEQVDRNASLVALDNQENAVGVALLAIRGRRGWCGGLGVVPSIRRQGLGRQLMAALIVGARDRDLDAVELECIDGNLAARALYEDLGFRAKRRLDIFDGAIAMERMPTETDQFGWRVPEPVRLWDAFDDYHPVPRAWQLNESALRGSTAGLQIDALALGDRQRPFAYVMFRPPANPAGRVSLVDSGVLASVRDAQRTLVTLVCAIARAYPGAGIHASNVAENEPLNRVLHSLGVHVRLTQTEMELALR